MFEVLWMIMAAASAAQSQPIAAQPVTPQDVGTSVRTDVRQEAAVAPEGWWNASWRYRVRVHLQTADLQEDLVDFPVGIRMAAGEAEAIVGQAQPGGADLRAVSAAGEVLPVEIVRWGAEGIELHVRVARIAAGAAGQCFDVYYGNAKAGALEPKAIWNDAYRAVLHLEGSLNDARSGAAVATAVGPVVVGAGAVFDAAEAEYLALAPEVVKGLGEQITIAVRFRGELGPDLQTLVAGNRTGADPNAAEWFNFGIKWPNVVHTNATSHGQQAPELNPVGLAPEAWHAATVRYDARDHSRTICIDGFVFEHDGALPGPLAVDEIRVGRGLLHFDPWQFHGVIDEVRIAGVARSDDWMRAETATLAERNLFALVGAPQAFGEPMPPPQAFDLIAPADGFESRSRAGVEVAWQPSAGAESYTVEVFADAEGTQRLASIDAGAHTKAMLPANLASGASLHWGVVARAPQGDVRASERRRLTFYDWSTPAEAAPQAACTPALETARQAQFALEGYLRKRIDRVVKRYLLETPESSPAMLQVLRDRDKSPRRDPLVPWAGEFAGKYLTAAELTWRLTKDEALKATIDTFVSDLLACQAENGYLGPFPASERLTGGNWDVWGHYHCMLGLLLYYEDTGSERVLDACKNAADLLFETFGPGGPTLTSDGSGGQMNMAVCHGLLLLYRKTGVTRYLELARYIVHEAWNEQGAGHYLESALAGKPLVEFPQHRWEAIHDWQALAELYWLTGDATYRQGFEHIWREGRRADRHNTGGVTSGEGFQGTPYHQGAIETCCTVAWLAFSVDMLRMSGDPRVADEIEWSTFNSALGAIPYSGRACAYNVPMDGTRVFGVELPWQAPKAGPDLNCCAVNANRALGLIAQWALMENAEGLVLNYYGPGTLSAELPSGNRVTLREQTKYPIEPRIRVEVFAGAKEAFTLAVRIPGWSRLTTVRVNGEATADPVEPGTYMRLAREWQTGDVIEISLDFALRYWAGEAECANRVAVYRGPLLLAFDGRYSELAPDALPAIDWKTARIEPIAWGGAIEPWMLATLSDSQGVKYPVCDFSSAGQSGNAYRSWLSATNLPPAPFSLLSAAGEGGKARFAWEARGGAERWSVLVATDPSFADATRIEASQANAEAALAAGTYCWQVVATNANGETAAMNGPMEVVVAP